MTIKTIMNAFFDGWRDHPHLSLHQLTVLDAAPEALAAIAGQLGCQSVCLFTHVPEVVRHVYPLVGPEQLQAVQAALSSAGVGVSNLEVFPLDGKTPAADFEPGLAIGAALGAKRATVHIHDADVETATARFAAFCDLAARHGIDAGLEFNAFSAVRDARIAAAIVRGAARPNGRVVLDLLHLVRSGGGVAEVEAIADLVDFVQLSDGPAEVAETGRWREAVGERGLPGSGAFPLAALLGRLRPGTIVDIEVPQTAARKAGQPPLERARRAVEAGRKLLEREGP